MIQTEEGGTSGSAGPVHLNIIGSKGRSTRLTITAGLDGGQKRTYTFPNVGDIGEVTGLQVDLVGNDGWNFQYIIVRNTNTMDETIFRYNSWLDGDDPVFPSNVTLVVKGTLKQ